MTTPTNVQVQCSHHAPPHTCRNGVCAACSEGDPCRACEPDLIHGVAPGEHHVLCDHPVGPHSKWCRHNEARSHVMSTENFPDDVEEHVASVTRLIAQEGDTGPNAGRLSGWNLEWNDTLRRYVTKDIADHIANLRHSYELKVADLAVETQRSGTAASQAALLVEAIVKIAVASGVKPEHIGHLTGPLALDLAGQVADRVTYLKAACDEG